MIQSFYIEVHGRRAQAVSDGDLGHIEEHVGER